MRKNQLTRQGFMELNLMEATEKDGDPADLWLTLEAMGYNRMLELVDVILRLVLVLKYNMLELVLDPCFDFMNTIFLSIRLVRSRLTFTLKAHSRRSSPSVWIQDPSF